MKAYFAGIDAGSTYVKVAILDETKQLVAFDRKSTGIDADGASRAMLEAVTRGTGVKSDQIEKIVATGYGRRAIGMADDTVTEIKAHAAGASWSAPAVNVRTVIDIGGQDSKVIILDRHGEIVSFAMNDKCAAGTGRFLESLARVLELNIGELGTMSLASTLPLTINSTCVVFAESEVISLMARKKKREDIVAGIHLSLANRIAGMARKAGATPEVLLTGGGGLNTGIARAIAETLRMHVYLPDYPQYNGAIGAALIARKKE